MDKSSSNPPPALLEIADIRKAYGQGEALLVLGSVSLAVRPGEFLSVVGPSGCGKTTLLLILAGLLAPDSGSVHFAGQQVTDGTPRGVAIVFQDYRSSLLPWKNVAENVVFGARQIAGVSRRDKAARAGELLDAVGLQGFAEHYPWQLSGGMQQRVAIARALAAQPQLLLLDEPLAAVDAQTRADVQDLLLDLAARFGQTCLLVTHDVDEAVYMSDRVVVLSNRPTTVVEEITIDLPKPRDQIATREMPQYLHVRHEVLSRIRSMRRPPAAGAAGGKANPAAGAAGGKANPAGGAAGGKANPPAGAGGTTNKAG